jgi:hypothetical protein
MSKKKSWKPIKTMIITYLAASKAIYWFNLVVGVEYGDFASIMSNVLSRFIFHDLSIILGVVGIYFLGKAITFKKSKYSGILENIVFYVVGYIALMGVFALYMATLNLFPQVQIEMGSFWALSGYSVIGYVFVSIFLAAKDYSKKKLHTDEDTTAEQKIAMLELLRDDGILSTDEFDTKVKGLLES